MKHAFVRGVSESLTKAIFIETPKEPIQYEKANQQHQNYTKILKEILSEDNVIEIPTSKGF